MLAILFATVASVPVAIHVDIAHRVQTIRPIRAIGSSVDSDPKGKIPLLYSAARMRLMLGTGLGMLTYRLYTELSIQDWHWNPSGIYSDPVHRQGYWTSSSVPTTSTITDSFGYHLRHRGDSRDQGDDDNYSRIDDGDPSTYWKSNPYLTEHFTREPDSLHPQWAVVQFLRPQAVDAIRIAWSNPYATRYRVEYWSGKGDAILDQGNGAWRPFPFGQVERGVGGAQLIRLAQSPVSTTAMRVLMTQSSNTCDSHGVGDIRNCVGYAIQDIGAGTINQTGFHDLVVRSKIGSCGGALTCKPDPKRQTLMWTSSDDPWHAGTDKVTGDQDQPGLDIVSRSGITRGLPTIYPVPVFYSTPRNAANEVRYLEKRGYPISYIEMGEEVDGQYALPEDYAALYVQFAKAIHAADPRVKLGGPIFEGVSKDVTVWPNEAGDKSWLRRFISYLRDHGHLRDFAFMSWEHYPFFNCDRGKTLRNDLLDEPSFVRRMVAQWRADGVPRDIPLLETEDNFSADGTGAPQRAYGALWMGDFIGASLSSGVSYATYYQAETEPLNHRASCNSWGAYNPYLVDKNFQVRAKAAAYYSAQLITKEWALPGDSRHGVYPVTTSLGENKALITSYALKRPDGTWSILVVNKDDVARRVTIDFGSKGARFTGPVRVVTFGKNQYAWSGDPKDRPNPDKGLQRSTVQDAESYTVAPRSLTVFRGRVAGSPARNVSHP